MKLSAGYIVSEGGPEKRKECHVLGALQTERSAKGVTRKHPQSHDWGNQREKDEGGGIQLTNSTVLENWARETEPGT